MRRNITGFTLVEIIVILVIIGILAAILVPALTGWIAIAQKKACEYNRSQIIRDYHYVQTLEYNNGITVKLSDVLAGNYDIYAEDVAKAKCPAGGTYTADDAAGTITCSIHGGMTDNSGEGDDSGDTPPDNSADYFYVAGNAGYKVATWGDLETYVAPQYGTNFASGTIFYYKGDYYFFRDSQYFTNQTDEANFVANCVAGYHAVKISYSTLTAPSEATTYGDLKLENNKVYLFFPYNRYYHDYENSSAWLEITLAS